MKKPDSIIIKENPNSTKVIIRTFDPMQLIFQIALVLIPFLLIELLVVIPDTILSISIFISGLLFISYWIIRNLISRYEIELANGRVKITSGYPFPVSKEIILKEIRSIKVKRRSGVALGGGRGGVTTYGPNVDDYFIVTCCDDDYLLLPKCARREKEYVKTLIEESVEHIKTANKA